MSKFNLDKYEGLASTTYIVDASTITSAALTAMITNSGGATHTLDSSLTTPGGRITLNSNGSGGKSVLTLPPVFGNAAGSLLAWSVELAGLYCQTFRPTMTLYASNSASETDYAGVRWDETGASVVSKRVSLEERKEILKVGNYYAVDKGDTGFLVDYQSQSVQSVQGQFGFAPAEISGSVAVQGTRSVRLSVYGSTAYPTSSIGFRQLKLTLFWGTAGDNVTKVY